MIFMKLFYMGINCQHMHCSRMRFFCMKCLQTAIVTQEKSCHQRRSKYSWCKDTHTHKHSQFNTIWWHGNTMVTLTEAPLQAFRPPGLTPLPSNSLTKVIRQQSRCRWLRQTYFLTEASLAVNSSVLHFYVCVSTCFCVPTCFCVYLFASRSECVPWWDKDAREPHPSLNSEINMYCAHAYSTY